VTSWSGTNAFRMMPGDDLQRGPATASTEKAAGDHGLLVRYRWRHPSDGDQEGMLLVGSPAEGDQDVTAAWTDSWHQQPGLMLLAGTATTSRIELAADYAEIWRWLITVELGERLTLTMSNVVPERHATAESPAGPYEVMVTDLQQEAGA
jgi:hypothetical protein